MEFHAARKLIVIGACVVVTVVGAAALIRSHSESQPVALASYPGAAVTQPAYAQPADSSQPGYAVDSRQPLYGQGQSGYNRNTYPENGSATTDSTYVSNDNIESGDYKDGYYSSRRRPVYVHRQEYVSAPQQEVREQNYREGETYRGRVYHRGRTKTHSVEIVAGTAAAGAAIGAIAGGGKGAAIGALSGGGAGFVYDRLTHKN